MIATGNGPLTLLARLRKGFGPLLAAAAFLATAALLLPALMGGAPLGARQKRPPQTRIQATQPELGSVQTLTAGPTTPLEGSGGTTVATPITLDFNTGDEFNPLPSASNGWFGGSEFYGPITYTHGGPTWTLNGFCSGGDPLGTTYDLTTVIFAVAGNNWSGSTITSTMQSDCTFELKSLKLCYRNYVGYGTNMDYIRIKGYRGTNLIADTGDFSSGPANVWTPFNQSSALVPFAGQTIDKLEFICKDYIELDDVQVVANVPAPTTVISSFVREDSAVTTASSVKYLLTFDKAVTGLTASNFDLNPTLSGASITDVSPKAGTSNYSWEVTVNTGTADGSLALRLANMTNMSPESADTLPKAGPSYIIDRTPPGVVISNPTVSSTGTGPVDFTVTYTDSNFGVINLSASDIVVLKPTGSATCGSVGVSAGGTANSRTVTLGSLSGNGTLAIQVKAATCTDTAGNTNAASGTSTSFAVVNKLSSTTGLTSSLNPATYGQSVTFTATVTAGTTGTVTFMDGSNPIGSATLDGSSTATLTTSTLGGGSHSITAVYGGDSAYNGSTSSALTQVVNTATPNHTLTSSLNPSNYGQSVTFTATLSAGTTGTVTFKDGGTTLGTASPNGSGVATLSTSTLSGGSHSITSVYGGDANWAASTSAALTQVVNTLSTATSLSATPNPSSYNQTVTLTATVTSGATGTVTFKDGATTLGTGTLSSGTATLTTSALGGGSHSLTAVYGGDANYNGSTSSIVTQVVNPLASTTSLSASPSPSTYNQTLTLFATVTSGATGTVTFMDGAATLGTGTLSSGTATLATSALAGGGHSLTAVYGGDANYNGSTSSTLSHTVNKASFTLPILTGPSPSTYGQTVTIAVSVPSDVTGTITFKDGSTTIANVPISNGAATLQTTTLPVGSHSFTAVYSGDSNYNGVTSGSVTQVVDTAASVTALNSSANPCSYGQTVTFTATVTSGATGTVTFKDGSTTLGTGTLSSGTATFTTSALATGSHSITAVYGGNSNFTGSTSFPVTQVVNPQATTTTLAASPNPSTYGQSVILTATVAAGATGTVTFKDGATTLGTGTLSGGTATFATSGLGGGSHSLTAVYGGDANYATSTSSALTQVVNTAATTTALGATPNPSTYGQTVTLTAAVTAGATGTVTFKDGATTLGTGTISGGTATFATSSLGGGSHSLTATYAGDANHGASTSSALTQVVNTAATTTTLNVSPNPSTYGQSVTFTATVTAGATGTVTFSDGASTLGTATLSGGNATFSTSSLAAVSHSITATYGGNANFGASTSSPVTQVVNKASATVTLGNLTAVYDGSPKSATATTLPANLTVTLTYNGSSAPPVAAGSYTVSATISDASYAGSTTGTLVISKGSPVITWANPAAIVRGTALGATQLNATCNVPGTLVYTPAAGTLLPVGAGQSLSVAFTPDDAFNYDPATKSVTIDVSAKSQAISFAPLPERTMGDAPFALVATADSGLAVNFASTDTSVITVSGGVVTLVGPGNATITATQGGDADWAAAEPVTQPLVVRASTIPPQVTLSTLPNGAVTTDAIINVSGKASSANGLASATVGGRPVTLLPDGTFSAALRLRAGTNPFAVVVTDRTGLGTTLDRTVTLNPTAPLLNLTSPSDNLATSDLQLDVQGTVDPNLGAGAPPDPVVLVTVALNGAAAQTATLSGTSFQFHQVLAQGLNTLDITATTAQGRRSQVKRTVTTGRAFTVNLSDPPADMLTQEGSHLIRGSVSNASGSVTVTLQVGTQTYTPTLTGNAFEQLVTFTGPGSWQISVSAQDGTSTPVQTSRNIVMEPTVAPSAFTLDDARKALRISLGLATATPEELQKYDLAPLAAGVPLGDGTVDINDAMLILRLALGQSL